MCPLDCDFAVELKVGLGANEEEDSLLVSIFSGLLDPALQTLKGLLVVNAEGEEDAADALVEGSHDGPKGLLTSLR